MSKIIGTVQEFDTIQMKGVEVDGRHILVVKLEGSYYAIGNECTHRRCRLSDGKIDGETVRCPCHGSVFNLKKGDVVKGIAKKPEPTYSLIIENGELSIA